MKRPQDLTADDIQRLLANATPEWYATNAAFVAGDHWQGGQGWSGPQLAIDSPNYRQTMDEIYRGFVSKNVVGEIVGRAVGGVLGHEPTWALTVRRPLADGEAPTAEEQALIREAEAALTTWWDRRGAHELLQQAAAALLWAGRAPLRVFVPPGLLVEGRVPAGDLAVSLGRIYLDHPTPAQASVVRDRSTMQEVGIYQAEEQDLDGKKVKTTEVSYQESGRTVLRALRDGEEDATALELGEHLMIYEMRRPALISDQVRQLQRLLNLSLSMLGRNVVLGGFLERVILNGLPPGEWVKDPATGKEKFVARPMQVGAGATNFISGQPIKNEQGKVTGYTSASVVYRDPVPVTTFRDTRQEAYQGILEECHQLHAAISGDATASGEARRQAMADFLIDLLRTAPQVNRAGRWLLETALALAGIFAGQPGRYAGLRAEFSCRIDLGPVSVEELRILIELVKARLMSRETAMSRAGIEDVAAELARILADVIAAQERAQQMLLLQQPAQQTDNTESEDPPKGQAEDDQQ